MGWASGCKTSQNRPSSTVQGQQLNLNCCLRASVHEMNAMTGHSYGALLPCLIFLRQRTRSASDGAAIGMRSSAPLSVAKAANRPPRSRTPENKTRTTSAFIPGQARQIRVVNGRVEVEKVSLALMT